jgi:hypothetical protein
MVLAAERKKPMVVMDMVEELATVTMAGTILITTLHMGIPMGTHRFPI